MVALVPSGVVTVTSTRPGACAGAVTVISVEETTVTPVALTRPKSTAVVPEKLVPVIVTGVPPVGRPATGLIVLTVGPVSYVNWSAGLVALGPVPVVTVTSTSPAELTAGETAVIWVDEPSVKLVAG